MSGRAHARARKFMHPDPVNYPEITAGICRRLNTVIAPVSENGGGDLNGTAALILRGHAGTGLGSSSMPRLFPFGGGS